MNKYQNKKLHVAFDDIFFIVIFLISCILSSYFYSAYEQTKALFNIDKTLVDYTITAPSQEQVTEIQNLKDVDKIVPYIFRTVECNINGEIFKSNMFIIENKDDLQYTTFSDSLLIKSSVYDTNALFVSSDFSKNTGISLGDIISIPFQDKTIKFTVSAIYDSDHRYVGGCIMAILDDELSDYYSNGFQYNGAFICSNDIASTNAFLKNYIPLGDLRSREEFDSDEQYTMYMEEREKTDFTKTTFYKEAFLNEQHQRHDTKLIREISLTILVFIIGSIICLLWLYIKCNSYTKKEVIKDIRNNYTIKKEQHMYSTYLSIMCLIFLISLLLSAVSEKIIYAINPLSYFNAGKMFLIVLGVILVKAIVIGKLKHEFAQRVKELRKESTNEKKEST